MTLFDAESAYRILHSVALKNHGWLDTSLDWSLLPESERAAWVDVAERVNNVARDRIAGIVAEALREFPTPGDICKAIQSWTSDSPKS